MDHESTDYNTHNWLTQKTKVAILIVFLFRAPAVFQGAGGPARTLGGLFGALIAAVVIVFAFKAVYFAIQSVVARVTR